jgi:FAD:protein FMN transferase
MPTGIVTHVRPRMGTWLALSVPDAGPDHRARSVQAIFDIAARAERAMSRHDPRSDLNRLNRTAGSSRGPVSAELARGLRLGRALSRRLDGAFDPTVGPLLDLWRRASGRGVAPSAHAVAGALARVGVSGLEIAGDRISLRRPGMSVDLDGFGKGLTLDRIAATLRRDGCRSAILNFGESSLLAIGRPPRARWSVALRDPRGGFVGEFTLRDRACSTSATFARAMRIGRRVAGDIVDPRTGEPVTRDAQVTVVASSAAAAEAISTALLVLGRDAVDEIAGRMHVDVCWIDRSGIHTSPWFVLRRTA